ncbi:MAG: phosphate acyltransferase PlsX [Clostridia bacterium]|nr:phosphate acyltransferase PlsX [Clostridia bacterium]
MESKIVLDCYGCDNPAEVIKGAAATLNAVDGVSLVLTGNADEIQKILQNESFDQSRLEIVDAREVIVNGESPVAAVRTKSNSSLVAAYERLKEDNSVKALISAGSTGAVLCGAVMLLGRCEGVKRPALASVLPADNGGFVCLADCGANVDSKPEHLLDYARFASAYMKSAFGISSPRVGLLSVGTEEGKGNVLTKEAYALLKESGLNFTGNVEAKSVLSGGVDVLVCDGFDGNVLLKSIEGTAKSVSGRLYGLLTNYAPEGTDTTFVKHAFKELFKSLDFNTQGSAMLLGVKKIVLKAHGSAVAETVVNTVKQAVAMINGGFDAFLNEKI